MQNANNVFEIESSKSIPPSWYVREMYNYHGWCNVTQCVSCGLTGKYEQLHPVDPCPTCGNKVEQKVGRWVDTEKFTWWKELLGKSPKGHWRIIK